MNLLLRWVSAVFDEQSAWLDGLFRETRSCEPMSEPSVFRSSVPLCPSLLWGIGQPVARAGRADSVETADAAQYHGAALDKMAIRPLNIPVR